MYCEAEPLSWPPQIIFIPSVKALLGTGLPAPLYQASIIIDPVLTGVMLINGVVLADDSSFVTGVPIDDVCATL